MFRHWVRGVIIPSFWQPTATQPRPDSGFQNYFDKPEEGVTMNSLEFDALQLRILDHLNTKGPTTSEWLATQLAAPHGNVRLALQQLHERKVPVVNRLPFGLWDIADQTSAAA